MVTWSIAWKEFRSCINSPVAYIFLIIFLLILQGTYFVTGGKAGTFFIQPTADLGGFFLAMPTALAILVPALAMKLWPDELKSGTVELLLSYPLKSWQVVVGKFFAGFLIILAGLGISCLLTPSTVENYGLLDWGPVWGGYLASALLGAAFLALGQFMGALCREQVTAFILTLFLCVILIVIGDAQMNAFIPKTWQRWTDALSFNVRFNYLGRGVVDIGDTLFFGSFTAMFLVLNVMVIECRKGR